VVSLGRLLAPTRSVDTTVYVCVAELLPAAYRERAASSELITLAFCMGCAVMAASLVIEQLATASKPEQGEQS
jgi:hypothetical protein